MPPRLLQGVVEPEPRLEIEDVVEVREGASVVIVELSSVLGLANL